jgi:hypothetical protein
MKKIILFSFLALAFFAGCKQEDVIQTADQVGISKVTYYPILTVNGDAFMTIAKGSTFTDPGATAMAGTETATITVAGTVDTGTPGTYTLSYTAVNKDGFSVTSYRIVGVYDESVVANDFSGSYARTTNGSKAVWTKLGTGLYSVFNPGGAPGTNLTIHAFNTTGLTIVVPPQVSSDGSTTSCTNASGGPNIPYVLGPPSKYAWHVVNPGYGTSLRTFVKQ